MTTPNPKSFLVKLGNGNVFNDPAHLSLMTVGEQRELLNKNGFKNVRITGSGKAARRYAYPTIGCIPFLCAG
jgi:hypothetical protein